MSNAPDVFVAWRYHISAALVPAELNANAVQQNLSELSSNNRGTGTTKVFVWLQDVPSFATYTKSFTDSLAGIFTLSSFHSRQLPLHAQSKTIVTPNGIDPDFFVDGSNSPTRFVYGSAPNRGLETVLRMWPFIRDAIITNYTSAVGSTAPSPRLDVYYGFTPAFVKYGQRSIPDFEEWRHKMEQLLEQDGVHYHGMVDHVTLAKGYASAGFVLYPTTYPETGCVTLMKAMAMGAVPITSRFAESTLPELTESFDLGPRPLLVLEEQQKEAQPLLSRVGQQHKQKDSGWTNEWAMAVVTASLRDLHGDGLAEHRAEMKRGSRRRFLWANVAQLWNGAFVLRPVPSV
jgi:glycosyltransferase involved in cell wall biosynthesis